ncbi:MAG: LptF/LptG family permease [Campylobacterota bacterium]|nr:LptF/LptG family permease [Campylobacterota bacterium]
MNSYKKRNLLKKYLISTYSQTFFPIFITLFTITSIIFLVKIASLTSVIQINFLELLELYSYSIPTILFYTLPVTIFISLCLSLAKLSSEYELIVITSFGLNPIKILKLIFPTLVLSSILTLIISLALIPKADYMKKSFLKDKKTEASFNIKASEYGQEFGKWLIYVNEEKNGLYKDIVLFNQDKNKNEDTFIIAKYATMTNVKTSLTLSLQDGKVLKIKEGVNQVDFKKMVINNEIKQLPNINTFDDLLLYWKDLKQSHIKELNFTFYILVSIFPLISIVFIIYIGYFNPRYDKNNSTSLGLLFATFYILVAQKLANVIGTDVLYYAPLIWVFFSLILYRYKIKPNY